jgi:type VI protein secretion system component VasF
MAFGPDQQAAQRAAEQAQRVAQQAAQRAAEQARQMAQQEAQRAGTRSTFWLSPVTVLLGLVVLFFTIMFALHVPSLTKSGPSRQQQPRVLDAAAPRRSVNP